METKNSVFIATSLDGFIADKHGNIDWLHSIPNPNNNDMGYANFISSVDVLIIGRTTYETVLEFGIDWPYTKPVYVLSTTLKNIPNELKDKVYLLNGNLNDILEQIHQNGHKNLYIDGGNTIQGFLKEDLIDEMIITTIPVLLGGGSSLFGELNQPLNFECIRSERFLNKITQNHYRRVK